VTTRLPVFPQYTTPLSLYFDARNVSMDLHIHCKNKVVVFYLVVTTVAPCWACSRHYHYIQCGGNSMILCILYKLNIPIHCKMKAVASTTSVASQCLLYCANQRMCTKVQPTLILLENCTAEVTKCLFECHFNVLLI